MTGTHEEHVDVVEERDAARAEVARLVEALRQLKRDADLFAGRDMSASNSDRLDGLIEAVRDGVSAALAPYDAPGRGKT